MKIGIIGCGAMGSVYASFFSSHDFEVSVIDKWEEHIKNCFNWFKNKWT